MLCSTVLLFEAFSGVQCPSLEQVCYLKNQSQLLKYKIKISLGAQRKAENMSKYSLSEGQ